MAAEYFIGIDEVGRGSLAGPVTVAAVAYPKGLRFRLRNVTLRDSKCLTSNQRGAWFAYINKHPDVFYTTASVSPSVIDRVNILEATNLAATRAFMSLIRKCALRPAHTGIFLDGRLHLLESRVSPQFLRKATTVVRGDEKYTCIKLASIVAKVTRDRYMLRKHVQLPKYGFDRHKGYGTARHYAALLKYGLAPLHRLTFCSNLSTIKQFRKART